MMFEVVKYEFNEKGLIKFVESGVSDNKGSNWVILIKFLLGVFKRLRFYLN